MGGVKRKRSRLAEIEIKPSADSLPPILASEGSKKPFTVRLPDGTSVAVPSGFDPEELFTLLLVVREALS